MYLCIWCSLVVNKNVSLYCVILFIIIICHKSRKSFNNNSYLLSFCLLTWWIPTGPGHTETWAAQHLLRCYTQSFWGSWGGCTYAPSWTGSDASFPGSEAASAWTKGSEVKRTSTGSNDRKQVSDGIKRIVENRAFSSCILSSTLREAVSCARNRLTVLVRSGSRVFPASSRTTRSNPNILSSTDDQTASSETGNPRDESQARKILQACWQ